MYECIQVAENTYYIASPSNTGLYVENGEAWIIDTGIDARAGKKIAKRLEENNWKPKAVINTHCHADHIGANAWLQKQFDIPVYANGMDCMFIENTLLSSMALWGAYPPRALQGVFFTAGNSKVTPIQNAPLPQGFEIIPFSGHSLFMIGLRTPDNIVFTADELCPPHILEKYGIGYNYCLEGYFKSLETAERLEAKLFVPAHGEPFADIRELTAINRKSVLDVCRLIITLCKTPQHFDMLLQGVFNHYGLNMTFAQYTVTGSVLRSYLSWLYDEDALEPVILDNILYWRAK